MPTPVMPLFVDADVVIERMQLDSGVTGVLDYVQKAIRRAQIHVETKVGGQLIRRSWDCMYYLDSEAFSGIQPNGLFRVELPCGCIRTDKTVVVKASPAVEQNFYDTLAPRMFVHQGDGPFTTMETADPQYYKIDYDRGFVHMSARQFRDRYIQVQCDSGFEPGTNPAPTTGLAAYAADATYNTGDEVAYQSVAWKCQLDDVTGIAPADGVTSWARKLIQIESLPSRLNEAVLAYAPIFLEAHALKDMQERVEKVNLDDNYVQALLEPYRRYQGFSFRPVWQL